MSSYHPGKHYSHVTDAETFHQQRGNIKYNSDICHTLATIIGFSITSDHYVFDISQYVYLIAATVNISQLVIIILLYFNR